VKLSEIRDHYAKATESLSSVARQLALAGIAVVWVIRVGGDEAGRLKFSADMLMPLYLFVLSLTSDMAQYVWKSASFGIINSIQWRRKKSNDAEVKLSGFINYPTNLFFWSKVALCALGYIVLATNLMDQIRNP
jgi:hypothetical protein